MNPPRPVRARLVRPPMGVTQFSKSNGACFAVFSEVKRGIDFATFLAHVTWDGGLWTCV